MWSPILKNKIMKVRFKKLSEWAKTPTKAHETDAGYDLYAESRKLDENGCITYGTGIAVEIPKGYVGLVFPRSSISKKDVALTNSVGVIDSGYRGEILFKFKVAIPVYPDYGNSEAEAAYVNTLDDYDCGERIGQLIILPYPQIELEEADELDDSDRGTGGFGSSGR